MKTAVIYHVFGPAETADVPEIMEDTLEGDQIHAPHEIAPGGITLVACKWYGDASIHLEVYGYDRGAAVEEWFRFRPVVVKRLGGVVGKVQQ